MSAEAARHQGIAKDQPPKKRSRRTFIGLGASVAGAGVLALLFGRGKSKPEEQSQKPADLAVQGETPKVVGAPSEAKAIKPEGRKNQEAPLYPYPKMPDVALTTATGEKSTLYEQIAKNQLTIVTIAGPSSGIDDSNRFDPRYAVAGPIMLNAVPKSSIKEGVGFLALGQNATVEQFNQYLATEKRRGNTFAFPFLIQEPPPRPDYEYNLSGKLRTPGLPYFYVVDRTGQILDKVGYDQGVLNRIVAGLSDSLK